MINLKIFFKFLSKEFIDPVNYILAFCIGALITILSGLAVFSSFLPYVVPFFVHIVLKTSISYKNREKDYLMQLPIERVDPAFLMREDGTIIAIAGLFEKLFRSHNVSHLSDLIGDDARTVIETMQSKKPGGYAVFEECYTPLTGKWYRAKLKKDIKTSNSLVWFDDITDNKKLNQQLANIREFSNELIDNLPELVEQNDSYYRMAQLILNDGYQGVFITNVSASADLEGQVFRKENEKVLASEPIIIRKDSPAPVWHSRRNARVVYANKDKGDLKHEFEKTYQFDIRVTNFLGTPVYNFINYHEGDISIIAFNLDHPINQYDCFAMETVVNSTRIVSSLIDLAEENNTRFIQSVQGLCAAAEHSDEITGKHIIRVNRYSEFLARMYCEDNKMCKWLGEVAAVHDIGKVAVPHLIKLKRRYTGDERLEMQMHTIYGAQILEKMREVQTKPDPKLEMACEVALNHHQNWNGKGYPGLKKDEGSLVSIMKNDPSYYQALTPLKAEEIPIEATIVSLADKYDALRSERQYKPGYSHEKTIRILEKDDYSGFSGEEVFGPDLFELFMRDHKMFNDIFEALHD